MTLFSKHPHVAWHKGKKNNSEPLCWWAQLLKLYNPFWQEIGLPGGIDSFGQGIWQGVGCWCFAGFKSFWQGFLAAGALQVFKSFWQGFLAVGLCKFKSFWQGFTCSWPPQRGRCSLQSAVSPRPCPPICDPHGEFWWARLWCLLTRLPCKC